MVAFVEPSMRRNDAKRTGLEKAGIGGAVTRRTSRLESLKFVSQLEIEYCRISQISADFALACGFLRLISAQTGTVQSRFSLGLNPG